MKYIFETFLMLCDFKNIFDNIFILYNICFLHAPAVVYIHIVDMKSCSKICLTTNYCLFAMIPWHVLHVCSRLLLFSGYDQRLRDMGRTVHGLIAT